MRTSTKNSMRRTGMKARHAPSFAAPLRKPTPHSTRTPAGRSILKTSTGMSAVHTAAYTAELPERCGACTGLPADPALRCETVTLPQSQPRNVRIATTLGIRTALSPDFSWGTTGILAARYAITRDDSLLQPLADEIRRNVCNITREVFWGSAGSALAALAIREATGTNRFDGVLQEVQQEYWASWPRDGEYPRLWLQEMYGKRQRDVGAGHGAFGNLAVFIRARDLLDAMMERELHERIVALLGTYALHDDDATNWLSMAEPRVGNRLQWCHGAPGIIMALAPYPRDDERVEELLRRGGEAIFRAGPLKKGPTFCHGTAGNGYALLRLAQRTGDVIWQERAGAFAMHVIAQTDRWREHYGMPAYSLFTGEIGVALFVQGVIDGDPSVLGLETL